ncbi:hypothetical protein [Halorubrum kocurii]|uniref:hypothetical protein n=1 Tax=Halorubrum kocurii TaxID=478441 RepID=UPI0012692211|nr:hypothetical protein [Halorubrum kocurii]
MSDDGAEKQLGTLASLTAAIEATQTEIKGVHIHTSGETYEAQVRLSIPVPRVHGLDRVRVQADHTEIVDNNLQFDLTVEVDSVDLNSPDTSRSASQDRTGAGSRSEYEREPTAQTPAHSRPVTEPDGAASQGDGEANETPSASDPRPERAETEPDARPMTESDNQEELPEYQDPEQLAAVYEATATFEEMRQELDVDVTAQTVRKYMIKHGIHEPEPRPDRLLETIRASELELMNSEEDHRSDNNDRSTDADTNSP